MAEINLNASQSESIGIQTRDPPVTQPTQPNATSKPPPPLGPPRKRKKTQVLKGDGEKEVNNRLRSEAWNHFTNVEGSNPKRATCNYCGKNYAGDPKNGTTNLFIHLQDQCLKVPWKQQKGQTQITDYPTANSKFNKPKELDVEYLRDGLARMVIIDEKPFSEVEKEGFKLFVGRCVPTFKLPSRMTVARDCMKLYIEERKKLKKILKDRRVCLTTDTWTSLQNVNYMVLTVHYIDDDWVLQKKILNFCPIESHKGAMIASRLEDCLHSWGIDKVLTLTVDNASSNDVCIQELLKDFNFKDVLLNNEFFHVRCSAHILNLVVRDGLKEYSSSIVRVRNACKYVKASPARLGSFKRCVRKEKIELSHSVILDVDTRWNSTFMMLERAEKFETAFDRLYKCDSLFQDFFDCYEYVRDDGISFGRKKDKKVIGPPKKDDWVVARDFVSFLKLFYEVTLKFSSTLHVTANTCVPELCNVKQSIDSKLGKESSSSSMFRMAMNMSSKYDKYWANWSNINHLLFVAFVLDPWLRLKGLDFCLRKLYGTSYMTKKVDIENHLNDLFMHYSVQPSPSNLEVPSSSQKKSEDAMDYESEDIYSMMKRETRVNAKNDSVNELSGYLSDALEEGGSYNVLGWWKSNYLKYPILSRIAKDILSIPVSTVASEQDFSTSRRVIDAYRSSLNPTTVEALICTQNWIRGTPTLEKLVEVFDEAEKYEEIAQESSNSGPGEKDDEEDND